MSINGRLLSFIFLVLISSLRLSILCCHLLANMKPVYCIYITTQPYKTVLYIGRTNDLLQRLTEHWIGKGNSKTFAGKYYCYNLLYYEETNYVLNAIRRREIIERLEKIEKRVVNQPDNPDWFFLNSELMEWLPVDPFHRKVAF